MKTLVAILIAVLLLVLAIKSEAYLLLGDGDYYVSLYEKRCYEGTFFNRAYIRCTMGDELYNSYPETISVTGNKWCFKNYCDTLDGGSLFYVNPFGIGQTYDDKFIRLFKKIDIIYLPME